MFLATYCMWRDICTLLTVKKIITESKYLNTYWLFRMLPCLKSTLICPSHIYFLIFINICLQCPPPWGQLVSGSCSCIHPSAPLFSHPIYSLSPLGPCIAFIFTHCVSLRDNHGHHCVAQGQSWTSLCHSGTILDITVSLRESIPKKSWTSLCDSGNLLSKALLCHSEHLTHKL